MSDLQDADPRGYPVDHGPLHQLRHQPRHPVAPPVLALGQARRRLLLRPQLLSERLGGARCRYLFSSVRSGPSTHEGIEWVTYSIELTKLTASSATHHTGAKARRRLLRVPSTTCVRRAWAVPAMAAARVRTGWASPIRMRAGPAKGNPQDGRHARPSCARWCFDLLYYWCVWCGGTAGTVSELDLAGSPLM